MPRTHSQPLVHLSFSISRRIYIYSRCSLSIPPNICSSSFTHGLDNPHPNPNCHHEWWLTRDHLKLTPESHVQRAFKPRKFHKQGNGWLVSLALVLATLSDHRSRRLRTNQKLADKNFTETMQPGTDGAMLLINSKQTEGSYSTIVSRKWSFI